MNFHGNKMIEIIKKGKRIHKFDLIEKAGISLSSYEKIKPWLEYRYSNLVRYYRPTGEWIWVPGIFRKEND